MDDGMNASDRHCGLCGHPDWLHRPAGRAGQLPSVLSQMGFSACACQRFEEVAR
jgi:hypothetical protein